MDPVTAIMIGTTAVAAGGQVLKGISENQAQREQARISQQMADRERQRAAIAADEQRRTASRIAAADVARRSGSGVDTNTGTPLAVEVATIGEGEFNAQQVLNEGALRAYRYEQEANTRKKAGQNALISGFINAGTTALTGAYRAYNLSPGGSDTSSTGMGVGYKVPKFGYGSANSMGPAYY